MYPLYQFHSQFRYAHQLQDEASDISIIYDILTDISIIYDILTDISIIYDILTNWMEQTFS